MGNTHVDDDCGRHAAELFQARVDSPEGFEGYPGFPDIGQHDERLYDHAGGGANAQQQHVWVENAHAVVFGVELPRQDPIKHQDGQGDDIINHRSPCPRLEHILRVQHGHEQRKHPVEENLRQQPVGETRGDSKVHLTLGA